MSGVQLCSDGLKDARLNEVEQFGFDVVTGELERELLGALTVTRLRVDLVYSVPDGLRGRLIRAQVDACAGPLDVGRDLFLIFGKTAEITGIPWEIAIFTVP